MCWGARAHFPLAAPGFCLSESFSCYAGVPCCFHSGERFQNIFQPSVPGAQQTHTPPLPSPAEMLMF
uniref:Putative secreted protein n=1 Tax=Anopheles darlingi TaxID=43151 RepID=A0A2M4DPZ4_ANODA